MLAQTAGAGKAIQKELPQFLRGVGEADDTAQNIPPGMHAELIAQPAAAATAVSSSDDSRYPEIFEFPDTLEPGKHLGLPGSAADRYHFFAHCRLISTLVSGIWRCCTALSCPTTGRPRCNALRSLYGALHPSAEGSPGLRFSVSRHRKSPRLQAYRHGSAESLRFRAARSPSPAGVFENSHTGRRLPSRNPSTSAGRLDGLYG